MSSGLPKRPEAQPDQACKKQALELLARREHSRRELERKLKARSFPDELIAATLDRLERSGALAVERFAASFVRVRVAKGFGPVRIRLELGQRGVEESECAAFLSSDAFDWNALAREARVKRFGNTAPRDFKDRAKQARFLQYRGFSMDQISSALDVCEDSD